MPRPPTAISRLPTALALAAAAVLFAACEPSGPARAATATDSLPPAPAPGSPVDLSMAETGEDLYRLKGCLACHKIGGGRAVGPDLQGVTRRRDYAWFAGIVLDPDSMFATDTTARRLLREHGVRMPDQRVQPSQVRALWEYLRLEDATG